LLRYSCLITGVLVTLLFLILLITCRTTGFPVAEGNQQIEIGPDKDAWRSSLQRPGSQLDGMGQVVDALHPAP